MNTIQKLSKKIAYYIIPTIATHTPHIPSKATNQEKKLLQYEKEAEKKINKAATQKTEEKEIAIAKEATTLYQQAITIAETEEIKNKEDKLLNLHSMKALAHHIAREPEKAIQSLHQITSLHIHNPSASIKLAETYKQIGDRHLETLDPNRFEKASQQYEKAIDILTQPENQAKDPLLLCYTYGSLAHVLAEQKQYIPAINQYQHTLDILQQHPKKTSEINPADCHYLIARTHFQQKNYQATVQHAQIAYNSKEKQKLKKATYATLLSLAHLRMNNKAEAQKYQQKAYKLRKSKLGKTNPLTQQTAQLLDTIQKDNPFPHPPTTKLPLFTNPKQKTQTPPNTTDTPTQQQPTQETQEPPQEPPQNHTNSLLYTGATAGSLLMLHKWKKTKKSPKKKSTKTTQTNKSHPTTT